MEKIKTSIIAKFLAWILIAISGFCLIGSAVLVFAMQEKGYYDRTFAEIREEEFARYSDRYSARVLEYLGNDKNSNEKYFADKNFKYGVIEADSVVQLEKMDLNDPKIYLERNFEEKIELENMHIFQCSIEDGTTFSSYEPNSFWGYYWINNVGEYWQAYEIENYVYDYHSGIFYCKADSRYFPVPNVKLYFSSSNYNATQYLVYDSEKNGYQIAEEHLYAAMDVEEVEAVTILEVYLYDVEPEKYLEKIYESEEVFRFNMVDEESIGRGVWIETHLTNYYLNQDYEVDSSYGFPIDLVYEDFSGETKQIVKGLKTRIGDGYIEVKSKDDDSKNYFVLSFQPDTLSIYGNDWMNSDLYVKFQHVYGTVYQSRFLIFGTLFASLFVFIGAFVFLCTCAGHRKGQTELAPNMLNKVPLELYAAAVGILEVLAAAAVSIACSEIRDVTDVFYIIILGVSLLAAGLLLTAAGLEVITRIKLKILLKNTIVYWIFYKIYDSCKNILEFAREHTSLMIRAILIFIGIYAAEFFIIAFINGYGGFGLLLLLAEKAVLFFIMLSVVVQLNKLKEAGKQIASGNLNYKIDTGNMFWEFKQHGEHLNSIGDGLSLAVDEKMKSERFKTELITNVSHDIKTPLTSIINYVDLLQKEEIQSQTVQEYLEVLERQSARLKKLLEDLLEASKASTGSLPVEFETLEAGVFMVQTVGEFEEKTSARELELIIKKPEEPVYIRADGRHFWRVIDNLMNNICKYAQPNTRVYINLEATEREVMITFRNTSRYALNITSEELMERFVRGDSSRNTEGSGLGLSIARSLMELMHGTFELVVDGDLFKVVLKFNRIGMIYK